MDWRAEHRIQARRVVLTFMVVFAGLNPSAAQAELLLLEWSGTVTEVDPNLSEAFAMSDPAWGSIILDSESEDVRLDSDLGVYLGHLDFEYVFGTYVAAGPGGGGGDSFTVINGEFDVFSTNGLCSRTCGPTVGDYFPTNLAVRLEDDTGMVFVDDSVPLAFDEADFPNSRIAIVTFQHPSLPSAAVRATIDEVLLVPEPAALLAWPASLVAVAILVGRRRAADRAWPEDSY